MEAEGVDDSFKKFGRRCPERKGRELERVADSSRGFLCRETSQRRICIKGRGVRWHQNSSSTDPVPQAKGTRNSRILTSTPEKRTQPLGVEL